MKIWNASGDGHCFHHFEKGTCVRCDAYFSLVWVSAYSFFWQGVPLYAYMDQHRSLGRFCQAYPPIAWHIKTSENENKEDMKIPTISLKNGSCTIWVQFSRHFGGLVLSGTVFLVLWTRRTKTATYDFVDTPDGVSCARTPKIRAKSHVHTALSLEYRHVLKKRT